MPGNGQRRTSPIRLDPVRWDAANIHSINTGYQLNDVVALSIAHEASSFIDTLKVTSA
jgi:hypothetical protein